MSIARIGHFFGTLKTTFSPYYRIKFQLIMMVKIMIMVMRMGMKITKNQSDTMTFSSKYTPFKHYYLVSKRTKPTGRSHLLLLDCGGVNMLARMVWGTLFREQVQMGSRMFQGWCEGPKSRLS